MNETAKEKEDLLKERSRKLSIKEGCAYSVSDGFGLRYITPFALALKASNFHIGLLASIPSLFGNLSQFYSARALEKLPRKKIVFYGVLLQAIMWLFLIFLGGLYFVWDVSSAIVVPLLVVFYTLLVLFGAFSGPAWSSWMRDLVNAKSAEYFGRRNKILGAVALVSMLVAGLILEYFEKTNLFIGFVILFGLAFVGRSISAYLFTRKYEPELKPEKGYYFSFFQFLRKMPKNNFGKFALFVALMTFAVSVASPFFAVYMLNELKFSYFIFTLTIVCHALFSLLFMPAWGKFADIYGNIKSIKITGVLISLVPFLWAGSVFFKNFVFLVVYIVLIEAFSGFAWAGFNLSMSNFIYNAVSRQRMALCVAYFNILNAIGIFVGANIGGLISSFDLSFNFSPLVLIIILSGILRLLVYLIMVSKIKEVRKDTLGFDMGDIKRGITLLSPSHVLRFFEMKITKPRPGHLAS
ncbi:MAG: MFS transporter [archaeon]